MVRIGWEFLGISFHLDRELVFLTQKLCNHLNFRNLAISKMSEKFLGYLSTLLFEYANDEEVLRSITEIVSNMIRIITINPDSVI